MIDLELSQHYQTKLKHRLTKVEVEAEKKEHGESFPARLEQFGENFIPGDELWSYNDIGVLAGTSGYAQVRNGQVIDILVIWQS
jgi:hypothetical protein